VEALLIACHVFAVAGHTIFVDSRLDVHHVCRSGSFCHYHLLSAIPRLYPVGGLR
jgi:hypothetical protein